MRSRKWATAACGKIVLQERGRCASRRPSRTLKNTLKNAVQAVQMNAFRHGERREHQGFAEVDTILAEGGVRLYNFPIDKALFVR